MNPGCRSSQISQTGRLRQPPIPNLQGPLVPGCVALVGLGIMNSLQDVKKLVTPQRVFIPNGDNLATYNRQFQSYKDIYKMNRMCTGGLIQCSFKNGKYKFQNTSEWYLQ